MIWKIAALLICAFAPYARAADDAWQQSIAQALGRSGTAMPDGVYRVGLPRTDLKVTLDGVPVQAGFALGSWLGFLRAGSDTMVMGDLVLTGDEVNPVMTKLEQGNFDMQAIDRALGRKGRLNGAVYQFSIPRAETIRDSGMAVPEALGSATAINFQSTGSGKAAITGDFVLTGNEVNPVLRELREHGIEVTALHNHMLDDEPRLFFMHFWANDDPVKLAEGLRAALSRTNVANQ